MLYHMIDLSVVGDDESKCKNKGLSNTGDGERKGFLTTQKERFLTTQPELLNSVSQFHLWLFIHIRQFIYFFFPLRYFKLGLNSNYIDSS